MNKKTFTPHHINATAADLAGNEGIGRYILLPGSDGRAKEIADHFDDMTVKAHSRSHHLYLGTITHKGKKIDVATVSSGMGCPSMEIILHELFHLGAKRFLRVGTAGSLQSNIKIGDIINVQASVRDEQTTTDYLPLSFPAISSLKMLKAVEEGAKRLGLNKDKLHTGPVHCKSSFYAREFGAGPLSNENNRFMDLLTKGGILATEMETAALLIQSQLYNHELSQHGNGPEHRVIAGAILAILAIPPHQFATAAEDSEIKKTLPKLAIESIISLSELED